LEELDFEGAYAQLEEIVRRLEAGEGTLEESLALFEKGIHLVRFCNRYLDGAEGRIKVLLEGNPPSLEEMEEFSEKRDACG
jgi:exodeoxyribonuclease VII small subunit